MPQKKNDLFEGRVARQIMYVYALVDEYAFDAIDVADGGLSGDDAF
jgi:hypothetical protein